VGFWTPNRYTGSAPLRHDKPVLSSLTRTAWPSYHQIRSLPNTAARTSAIRTWENPEHTEKLLAQRRAGRQHAVAHEYHGAESSGRSYQSPIWPTNGSTSPSCAKDRRPGRSYGSDKVARALEDALAYQAFSPAIHRQSPGSTRATTGPAALDLTRRHDLLDLDLPEPDCPSTSATREVSREGTGSTAPGTTPGDASANISGSITPSWRRRPLRKHWTHIDYLARLIDGETQVGSNGACNDASPAAPLSHRSKLLG